MTAVLSFQAAQYPADTRHAPHEHAALQLSLVLAGRVVETVGRVTEHAGALSVVCKAAGVVHANVFGREGARLARLTLADGDLASLLDDPARASDWRWTHDPAVAAPFLRLVQHATTRAATRDSTCDTTRDTTGDTTIAADDPDLLDLLAAFSARPVRPRSGEAPAWLAETRDRMIAEWTPLMTVGVIARRAEVHPYIWPVACGAGTASAWAACCAHSVFGPRCHTAIRRVGQSPTPRMQPAMPTKRTSIARCAPPRVSRRHGIATWSARSIVASTCARAAADATPGCENSRQPRCLPSASRYLAPLNTLVKELSCRSAT